MDAVSVIHAKCLENWLTNRKRILHAFSLLIPILLIPIMKYKIERASKTHSKGSYNGQIGRAHV